MTVERDARVEPNEGAATWLHRSGRWFWLTYLLIYPLPWLGESPSSAGLVLSAVGIGLFLACYAHAYARPPDALLPNVLLMAAIGYGLSPFGGAWSVFLIFAVALAARMEPKRSARVTMAALLASLPAVGLAAGLAWIGWGSGLLFGMLAAIGTLLQTDLERRNRLLLTAQREVRVLAAATERERIGRDLHDLLGHSLTLIAIKADLATQLCHPGSVNARREMEDIARSARDALTEVRSAVAGMTSANLAAEWARAGSALQAAGIDVIAEGDPVGIDPAAGAVLAMALREAVTNVIRHARARTCFLRIVREACGAVRLCVGDDGHGGVSETGAGLSGMRTRLGAAGGTLTIQPRETGGTLLSARLPLLQDRIGVGAAA